MKLRNAFPSLVLAALVLVGCGKQMQSARTNSVAESPTATAPTDCPIAFATLGICAELVWTDGPKARTPSSFEVKFWDKATGRSIAADVTLAPEFIMSCCGSSLAKTYSVKKLDVGHFRVEGLKLSPNMAPESHWEIFFHVVRGSESEKLLASTVRV